MITVIQISTTLALCHHLLYFCFTCPKKATNCKAFIKNNCVRLDWYLLQQISLRIFSWWYDALIAWLSWLCPIDPLFYQIWQFNFISNLKNESGQHWTFVIVKIVDARRSIWRPLQCWWGLTTGASTMCHRWWRIILTQAFCLNNFLVLVWCRVFSGMKLLQYRHIEREVVKKNRTLLDNFRQKSI